MNSIFCTEFKKASEYIFQWLKKQPSVGEESITDWMLFSLEQSLPSLRYKKFTRHHEARVTGADWEWWIVGNNSAISMRIQAKKIIYGKDNYAGLAHTNRYGLQIEKLIKDANRKNFIPLYALYCSPSNNPQVICGGKSNFGAAQGVFISSAQHIYDTYIKNTKIKVNAEDLLSHSNPMHCMACCLMNTHENTPTVSSFYGYLEHYYPDSMSVTNNTNDRKLGWYEKNEIPSYVATLLQESEIPEWWDNEFKHQLPEVDSIVIIDLRDK